MSVAQDLLNKAERLFHEAQDRLKTAETQEDHTTVNALLDQVQVWQEQAENVLKRQDALNAAKAIFEQPATNVLPTGNTLQSEASDLHSKALGDYFRYGMRTIRPEYQKALSQGIDDHGGVLVDHVWVDQVLSQLANRYVTMRALANVLPPISASSVSVPVQSERFSDPSWTSELGEVPANSMMICSASVLLLPIR